MEQRKAQTTTNELGLPEKDMPETTSDYETAFPMSADQSKQVYENTTTNNPAQTDIIPPAYVEITDDKQNLKDQLHSKKGKDNVDIGNTVNNNNFVSKAGSPKPNMKPNPADGLRRSTDKSNRQDKTAENDNDEIHDYENALTKVTMSTLQQAKLLKSVPPPCNANPYANVPNIDILEDASGKPVQRQSSEYEDPENLKSKFHEKKFKNAQIKPPNASSNEFDRNESTSKIMKSKCNARDVNQSGTKYKQNESRAKSTGGPKPVYANINEKNETDLKPPDCEKFDYENQDTVQELKSTLRMQGKRGFSTSSLETRKQESYLKTGMNKKKARTGSDISKESDDTYLPMDVLEIEDKDYLKMDDLNDDVYMPMATQEESVYMRMESNSIPNRVERHGRQPPTERRFNLPRGYLTSPKPCAGTQSGYVNFSDQPVKYVNFFRSRSSDDVNTNCTYDYAKMRNSKL